jgi:zinc finger MYND domain-containing protein 11
VPNFDRVSRYLLREHEIDTSEARKLLRRMCVEKLVVCYTSVTSKGDNAGAEQDGYRLPSVEEDDVERVSDVIGCIKH